MPYNFRLCSVACVPKNAHRHLIYSIIFPRDCTPALSCVLTHKLSCKLHWIHARHGFSVSVEQRTFFGDIKNKFLFSLFQPPTTTSENVLESPTACYAQYSIDEKTQPHRIALAWACHKCSKSYNI